MLPDNIYLIAQNKALYCAWDEAFTAFDGVVVIHGDLFSQPADAVVSPANSFGFMDGGVDKVIRDRLPAGIQNRVQAMIVQNFYGEMPVGTAAVVETGDKQWPHLVVTPTMRIPEGVARTMNAYLAFRAILIALRRFNEANPSAPIRTVNVPGLCTGWGGMDPMRCAGQMRIAYDDVSTPARIPSMNYIRDTHKQLKLT